MLRDESSVKSANGLTTPRSKWKARPNKSKAKRRMPGARSKMPPKTLRTTRPGLLSRHNGSRIPLILKIKRSGLAGKGIKVSKFLPPRQSDRLQQCADSLCFLFSALLPALGSLPCRYREHSIDGHARQDQNVS